MSCNSVHVHVVNPTPSSTPPNIITSTTFPSIHNNQQLACLPSILTPPRKLLLNRSRRATDRPPHFNSFTYRSALSTSNSISSQACAQDSTTTSFRSQLCTVFNPLQPPSYAWVSNGLPRWLCARSIAAESTRFSTHTGNSGRTK